MPSITSDDLNEEHKATQTVTFAQQRPKMMPPPVQRFMQVPPMQQQWNHSYNPYMPPTHYREYDFPQQAMDLSWSHESQTYEIPISYSTDFPDNDIWSSSVQSTEWANSWEQPQTKYMARSQSVCFDADSIKAPFSEAL